MKTTLNKASAGAGIKIDTTNGPPLIVITQVQRAAAANESVGTVAGLQVATISNASHVNSLAFGANGAISFKLESNFNGDAGFDYTFIAPDAGTVRKSSLSTTKTVAVCARSIRAKGLKHHVKRAAANDFAWGVAA